MKRKSRGQTLVEFALVFPIMMVFFFGIIDMAYYVYGWAEIQFGARRGAEEATLRQPNKVTLTGQYTPQDLNDDPCLAAILVEAQRNGAINGDSQIYLNDLRITFHESANDTTPENDSLAKSPGRVVQIGVRKTIEPLTPLTNWILGGRDYNFQAYSRRTIVANGPPYIDRVEGDTRIADYNKCIYENK